MRWVALGGGVLLILGFLLAPATSGYSVFLAVIGAAIGAQALMEMRER